MNDDKKKYLSLSQDIDELKHGYGAKEKSLAGFKILAKGFFNAAKYIVTEAPPHIAKAVEREKNRKS